MFKFLVLFVSLMAAVQADVITVTKDLSGDTSVKVSANSLAVPGVKSVLKMLQMTGGFSLLKSGATEFSLEFSEKAATAQVIVRLADGQMDRERSFAYKNMSFSKASSRVFIADEIIRRLKDASFRLWNSRIAFSVQTSRKQREIFSCYPDGSGLKQLTRHGRMAVEPVWKGGPNSLSYIIYTSNGSKLIQYDLARNRQKIFSSFTGLNAGISYSSTGQWAALTLSKDGMVDLYCLTSADSRRGNRLTKNTTVEASPVWSPRDSQICYVSSDVSRSGKITTPRLNIMGVKSRQSRRLFQDSSERVSPDWSRQGLLVYSKRVRGQYVLATCNPNSPQSTERVLSRAAGHWEAPSWAANGRHIICTRKIGAQTYLYLVDSQAEKPTSYKIALNLKGISLPDWSALK